MPLLSILFLFNSWIVETVARDTTGASPPLAIDSLGNPYVIISRKRTDSGPQRFYYLILHYKVNGRWYEDTFESNACKPTSDITIDRYNRVWVIYVGYNQTDTLWYLIVARKDSGGWTKDTVVIQRGSYFTWFSIATDNLGRPHITYDNLYWGPGMVGLYAYWDGTTWHKEIVDSMVNSAYCCAIDIDSQNRPHISYFHFYTNLRYATKIAGAWYYVTLDSAYRPSWWTTSIKVGPNDLPAIAYKHPWTYQLKYAYYDGLTWHIDTVDYRGTLLTTKVLDMDSLGRPFLCSSPDFYSFYAYYKEDGIWYKEALPALEPPLIYQDPGALRIGRDRRIHLTRYAFSYDLAIRAVHYIYGTITGGIKENNYVPDLKGENLRCQVLPNIIRRNAKVRYNIPKSQFIKLNLHDIQGQRVATIFDGIVEAGIHSYKLDLANLSAGVYFVVLEGENHRLTEKIVLLK